MDINKIQKRYFPDGAPKAVKGMDDVARYVERRFYQMAVPRNQWYQRVRRTFALWDVFQPWLLEGEYFDRAVRFPTLRDVAMAIKNEIMRVPPEAQIEALMGENPERAQAMEFRIKEIKDSIYERRVQEDCIMDMLFYGIGYRMVNFYDETNDIGSERIDPTDVFWDQEGRYIYDNKRKDMKRDVTIRRQYPYSTFLELFSGDGYKNADAVQPYSTRVLAGDQNYPTFRQSEEKDFSDDIVNVYHHINQEEGFQTVVAQGITIKEPCDLNNHGRIPLVSYIFEKRRDSFYPNSLAELIAPHIYAQDTIFNLELMGLKLDLMPATMIDASLGYNPKIHKLSPKAIWQMNVPANKNLSNMVYPFQRARRDSNGFYAMNNYIESRTTITSNVDRNSLYLSPGELATQTAAKNQSMQRGVNALIYANELEAEGQMTELMVELCKEYANRKVKMKKRGKEKEVYRKVKVDGYAVFQQNGSSPTFLPSQGKESYFEFNEETSDVDVKVTVKSMRTKMMLQEQKVARLTQGIPVITNFVNAGAQVDPEILKKVDWNGIIEQWAEANDLDLKRTLKSLHSKIYDRVQLEHKAIMANIPLTVPPDESMEESQAQLKEHLKLRFVYDDGRMTQRETEMWKNQMTPRQKALWARHISDTLENIKKKLEEAVSQPLKKTGGASEIPEETGPGGQLPNQPVPAGGPPAVGMNAANDIASKTMLNNAK